MLFAYVRSSLWKINWATGEIDAHFLAQNIILIPIFIPIVILGIIFSIVIVVGLKFRRRNY